MVVSSTMIFWLYSWLRRSWMAVKREVSCLWTAESLVKNAAMLSPSLSRESSSLLSVLIDLTKMPF